MVRCNGLYWTADFTLARAIGEAYRASGKEDVVYVCLGDPASSVDQFGPYVGAEIQKYFPQVLGTYDRPVTETNLGAVWREVQERWPDAFVIGIEGGAGAEDALGFVEVTDRGLQRRPATGREELPAFIGDIGVHAFLWSEGGGGAGRALDVNKLRRVADSVIDAQIRFLQKVGKYAPVL